MTNPIAIIGAGLAGLCCARRLTDQGLSVELFDKARGPGGRMATRRVDGYHFDHGAQFFKVHERRFGELVEAWEGAGLVARWHPRQVEIEADGSQKALPAAALWVGVPRMSAITRALSGGLTLHTQVRVAALEEQSAGWLLLDEAGQRHGPYSAVLLTCPPPQTADILGDASPLAKEVSQVRMLPCWAVLAAVERPLELPFDTARVTGSPLDWLARNASKPQRGEAECWVLHATHEWSETNLEREREEIASALLEAFAKATGERLQPVYQTAHRWRYAKPAEALGVGALVDRERRLGVAGDWCQAANVEGACLSGLELADCVLNWAG